MANERKTALAVLAEVEEGAFFNLALKKHLRGLPEQEKRFITALCFTTLENKKRIDYVIAQFTQGKRVHRLIQNILRLGVCQLMFFESVPESAAVNECVKLAEQSPKRQLKGFVNGVLRNVARHLGEVTYPAREAEPAAYLAVTYSYPQWLAEKYMADYGMDFAEAMLAYKKEGAATCIRPNRLKIAPADFEASLRASGLAFAKGAYCEDAYYVKNISAVDDMRLYKKGCITVQGEASMLAVMAADIQRGMAVLDLCAAPGGKTAYAVERRPGRLVAQDIHPHRVVLMEENFARLGVVAETAAADAAIPVPGFYDAFDRVMVDAPCSALGLLYRKPDIKAAKEREDLAALEALQRDILETASRYVKKGGRLVYSTCTINRGENDGVIDWFLARHEDFQEAPLAGCLPEALPLRGGRVQLFPHLNGIDGFFIATLERRAT